MCFESQVCAESKRVVSREPVEDQGQAVVFLAAIHELRASSKLPVLHMER